ncbi:MAG: polysaccharide deacetylase family protein [Solobacterium sp.]|nr:polysaccharide deacetylase family protein [Solobacterium sp.]
MAAENRKASAAAAAALIVAVAGFAFAGRTLLNVRAAQKQLEADIRTLNAEKDQLTKQIADHDALMAEKDQQIAELNACDQKLADQRAEYYAVCKELEDAVLAGTADFKIAYLTFDDGPYLETTREFLQVLKDRDILATFFQIAREGEDYDALYHEVYEAGHTIANHTYSHRMHDYLYLSVDNFISDIVKNREFIQEKLGITTNIARFPGGSGSALGLKSEIVEELRKLGYGYVDWTAATGDGIAVQSPEEYLENVMGRYNWGGDLQVVLMHDYSRSTLTALPAILDGFAAQGYIFLPLYYESSVIVK